MTHERPFFFYDRDLTRLLKQAEQITAAKAGVICESSLNIPAVVTRIQATNARVVVSDWHASNGQLLIECLKRRASATFTPPPVILMEDYSPHLDHINLSMLRRLAQEAGAARFIGRPAYAFQEQLLTAILAVEEPDPVEEVIIDIGPPAFERILRDHHIIGGSPAYQTLLCMLREIGGIPEDRRVFYAMNGPQQMSRTATGDAYLAFADILRCYLEGSFAGCSAS